MRRRGGQQLLLAINQSAGIKRCQLKPVPVGDSVGGASLHAVSAEDTTVVIDVVDLSVPLCTRNAILFRVFRRLDINAIRWAGGGTEKTRDTFFQSIFVALQHMLSAESLLKLGALERPGAVRIILDDGRLEHLLAGDGHSLNDGADVLNHGHIALV